jgi:GTPase Era involved in 16S rRNA processing
LQDLAGQSKDQWSEYLSECDVVIFVVDSSDTSKIEEASKELHHFAKNALHDRQQPLLIVSNKIDCEIHYSLKEVLHHLQLNKLHRVQWVLKETSATQGTNVTYVLNWLTKYAKEKDDALIVTGKQE